MKVLIVAALLLLAGHFWSSDTLSEHAINTATTQADGYLSGHDPQANHWGAVVSGFILSLATPIADALKGVGQK